MGLQGESGSGQRGAAVPPEAFSDNISIFSGPSHNQGRRPFPPASIIIIILVMMMTTFIVIISNSRPVRRGSRKGAGDRREGRGLGMGWVIRVSRVREARGDDGSVTREKDPLRAGPGKIR